MKILLALILVSTNAWALDAVITVLEAPIFEKPDASSKIVQYKRKGDIIRVHPSLNNDERYDDFRPSPAKLKKVRAELESTPEWQEDPLFRGRKLRAVKATDEYIPVLDRQGHEAYVLSSHIYVYYENRKELDQKIDPKDPTDYRLQEPLPKNYPLKVATGYRGVGTIGITQPYTESYPYLRDVKTKGYMSPIDFNFTLLKRGPSDTQNRFYAGGTLNVRYFSNRYLFTDNSQATERYLRIGIGPYFSYDAFKGEKNRVNLFASICVNPLDQVIVSQTVSSNSDDRLYRAFSVSPRVGFQYHRKNIIEELDFVLGTAVEFTPPTTYKAQDGASQSGMWRNLGKERYTTRNSQVLAFFFGLQSAY